MSCNLFELKVFYEQKIRDSQNNLKRVLSRSNSGQSIDKAEVAQIKDAINVYKVHLENVRTLIEAEENGLTF